MIRDTKSPTRQELSERAEDYKDKMEDLHDELDKTGQDLRTLKQLKGELDRGGGTADGLEEVDRNVEGAQDATEHVFDDRDRDLDRLQDDHEGYRGEVDDRKDASKTNLGIISDVTAPLKTDEAVREIRAAKEAMLRDVEALEGLERRIRENAERSREVRERLRGLRGEGG